ncbi:uncharacterized protein LOC121057266 [Cygnus olor]|uniref:uncharacterized protein LOC121057266 n=1 Tax=Cygnus olor TaxID=8869 RepID=UPI001ADE6631|nr:uncharacterized protein LOC121057266 [Cygnus olor]XP_040387068.1 uncharacterized protein LOC121057266 [Cygnus olor]
MLAPTPRQNADQSIKPIATWQHHAQDTDGNPCVAMGGAHCGTEPPFLSPQTLGGGLPAGTPSWVLPSRHSSAGLQRFALSEQTSSILGKPLAHLQPAGKPKTGAVGPAGSIQAGGGGRGDSQQCHFGWSFPKLNAGSCPGGAQHRAEEGAGALLSPSPCPGLLLPACLYFSCRFLPGFEALKCCIVASDFVVFPAQLEAGGTRNREMERKKKKINLARFLLAAEFTKTWVLGEPRCWRSSPALLLFRPLLISGLCSPQNHPLIPQLLSGHNTKHDPGAGVGAGRITQPLNLFHLFLWLRIVREQMAIFSSVSLLRRRSLRQRRLKQIRAPLQSHHLVFPSAQPLLSAWARLQPAPTSGAGWGRGRGGAALCLSP